MNCYFHLETNGPTGSWKDRYVAALVPSLVAKGYKGVSVRSSGNHGLALAFQAKQHDLPCFIEPSKGTPKWFLGLWRDMDAVLVDALEDIKDEKIYKIQPHFEPDKNNNPGATRYEAIAMDIHKAIGGVPDVIAIPCCYGDGSHGIISGFQKIGKIPSAILLACASSKDAPAAASIATNTTTKRVELLLALGAKRTFLAEDSIREACDELARQGIYAELSAAAGFAALRSYPANDFSGKTVCVVISAKSR